MCQKGNQVMTRIATLEKQYKSCFYSLEQEKRERKSLEEENRQLRKELDRLNKQITHQKELTYPIAI